MILIVSYELKGPASNYSEMFELLKKQPKWSHYIASTWVIQTTLTPKDLNEQLKKFLIAGDRLLVAKIDPAEKANGWLPNQAWEWMNTVFDDNR